MEGKDRETCRKAEREQQRQREKERGERDKKEMGGGEGPPSKRECSKCAQDVLLVAAAEDYPARIARAGQYGC